MTPTEPVLYLAVKGAPAPQGSKRTITNRFTGRASLVESSKKVKPWREAVRSTAVEAWGDRRPLDEPVRVGMVFTFARPKSHYRTGRNAHMLRDGAPKYPASPPDASKLARSTEDALTDAGVWRDDARVVRLGVEKVWAGEHPDALDSPGAVIRIWTVGP